MGRETYRKWRFGAFRLREPTWEALARLRPGWQLVALSDLHHKVRESLEHHGLAEIVARKDEGYVKVRPTAFGLSLRDDVYRARAWRLSHKIWKGR